MDAPTPTIALPVAPPDAIPFHKGSAQIKSTYERLWDEYSRWWDSKDGLSNRHQYLGDEWGDDAWVRMNVESFVLPHLSKDSKVLEIGPGGGRYTASVAEHCAQVMGVDVSPLMVERLQNRFGINDRLVFFKGSGHDLSGVPDDSVDFVFSFNVFVQLEFEDIVSYLREIKRVLKPGGKAALHYATISNTAGWAYFLDHCQEWMNRPNARGHFCELTLDTMALLTERLSLRLLTNQPVGRDALVVFEKPRPRATLPLGSWMWQPERKLTYPILFPKGTNFFFVAGSMRSGTTWLMDLLNSHPEICCGGEMHSVEVLGDSLPTLESVARNCAGLKHWYLMENNSWCDPFRTNKFICDDIEGDFIRFFFEWTLLQFVRSERGCLPRFIGDKSPVHTRFIARKLREFFGPYEPFVLHLVRDPRDAAVSRWFQMRGRQRQRQFEFAQRFRGADDEAACHQMLDNPEAYAQGHEFFSYPEFLPDVFTEWVDVNGSLASDGREGFGDRYLRIRYEDMKADLTGVLAKIFTWFGVNRSPTVVQEIIERNDITRLAGKKKTFRKGATGEWVNYFSPQDIALFNSRVLPLSREFGYE